MDDRMKGHLPDMRWLSNVDAAFRRTESMLPYP